MLNLMPRRLPLHLQLMSPLMMAQSPPLSQSKRSESILHTHHDTTLLAPSPVSLHHNPRLQGTLDFYFSHQLRVTNTDTNAMTDPSSSIIPMDLVPPTTNNTSTPIEVQHSQRFHQQQLDTTSCDTFQASCSTLKPNDPWGDDYSLKYTNSFRLYFQNINNLGLSQ